MEDNGLKEVENVVCADLIVDAALAYKQYENDEKISVAEKYKDYDFVGNAGKKLLGAFKAGKEKAIRFLGKSKEFINNDIYKTLVRAEERKERREEIVEKAKKFIKNDFEKTVEREKARQEAVHKFEDRMVNYLDEKILDTADKISDGIQRFNSKSEALGNAIKNKHAAWKAAKKEKFAEALENTKAFGRCAMNKKRQIQKSAAQVTIGGINGLKRLLDTAALKAEEHIDKLDRKLNQNQMKEPIINEGR